MSSRTCDRRRFLQSAAALASAAAWPSLPSRAAHSADAPNDRLRIGAIGVGGRGSRILEEAARFGDVAAVCDVDRERAESAWDRYGGKPTVYTDYRRLLDRKDIDVVLNAAPDHWHTAINIAACRAGKDVYTEKPLTLTIEEGRLLCKVVKETGRVVQVGTQQRSERQFQTAVELVRNGRIGRLQLVAVILPFWNTKGGPFLKQPVPPGFNWDFYQGQAPEHDYHVNRTHFNFRWWFEYAGGIITDWGNHHMDIAHWGMDVERSGPLSVQAKAFFPNQGQPDCYNNPDRFVARMEYPGDVDLWYFVARDKKYLASMGQGDISEEADRELFAELPESLKKEDRNGILFAGDRGRIFVNRGGLYGAAAEQLREDPLPPGAWRVAPSGNHMGNFFDCVKTRRTPVSPVEIQHRTVTACHLGNIAIRLKRPIRWDPEAQQVVGDDEANGWQRRKQRPPYTIEA